MTAMWRSEGSSIGNDARMSATGVCVDDGGDGACEGEEVGEDGVECEGESGAFGGELDKISATGADVVG